MPLVLEALGGDQALDLRSLRVGLLLGVLGLNLATNHVLADIILLGETEKAADLGGAFGTETLGVGDIGKAGNVTITLLDDNKGEDSEVHTDNASTDRLPLTLSGTAGSVAGVALGEKEADTSGVHNTLLHGETLLVVTAGDLENVALELIADGVTGNFLTHAFVDENTETALIIDFDELLSAVGGISDIELHDCNDFLWRGQLDWVAWESRLGWC